MAIKKSKSNKKPKDIGDYGDYSKKTMEKLNKLVPFSERRQMTKGMNLKHGEMEVRQMALSRDQMSKTSAPSARSGPSAGGQSSLYARLTGGLMKHGR